LIAGDLDYHDIETIFPGINCSIDGNPFLHKSRPKKKECHIYHAKNARLSSNNWLSLILVPQLATKMEENTDTAVHEYVKQTTLEREVFFPYHIAHYTFH
jgi:hypothetical protein